MRKLTWNFLILAVMVGCLIVITTPQRTQADIWGDCDAERSTRNAVCQADYNTCIANNGSNCTSALNACLDTAAQLHHDYSQSPPTGCIFDDAMSPVPWPVNSDSRSLCIQGCMQGAATIPDPADRLEYSDACADYCNEQFPKP